MELPAGTLLGNYVVELALGSGGFAIVYKAAPVDKPHNAVAIKACHNMGVAAQLTKEEASVLEIVKKEDPHGLCNCVRLLSQFQDESGTFTCLVFPLLGLSVFSFLRANNHIPFPRKHVQKLGGQLLNALSFIHSIGIVHCDLKSDNVLLKDDSYFEIPHGKGARKILLHPHLCLCDFGLARVIKGRPQTDKTIVPYPAPEICLNLPWDYAVDVYAAGLVMYEMILGRAIIPARCPAATTLALLRAFFGPLPSHLAKHASKATDVPFKKVNRTILNSPRFAEPDLNFKEIGVTKKEMMDVRVLHQFKTYKVEKEDGGPAFLNLMDKMLKYDPKERITAVKALKHFYFQITLPQPVPPQMQYRQPPQRS